MKKFFLSLLLMVILIISLNPLIENPAVSTAMDKINKTFNQLIGKLDKPDFILHEQNQEFKVNEKPKLEVPTEHAFSIHNIVLGEKKEAVENKLGAAKRSSLNEYNTEWFTYHENYQNFIMVAYDENNEVVGLYTNQDLISSTKGIKLNTPKDEVLQLLGQPLTKIQKGFVYFQYQKDRDYDVFHIDGSYLTIFYDKHNQNRVSSMQIVKEELEKNRKEFYSDATAELTEGFEYQLFDLTNADRVKRHLPVVQWDENARETARKHSMDMALNNYFSHTNPSGESPFDRMKKDDIFFTLAGENLASGQFSSIFAHEGLMNSLGHRENILHPEFQFLGVGVSFNSESQPYYTENFFTK